MVEFIPIPVTFQLKQLGAGNDNIAIKFPVKYKNMYGMEMLAGSGNVSLNRLIFMVKKFFLEMGLDPEMLNFTGSFNLVTNY
jgi:hypothetical protein